MEGLLHRDRLAGAAAAVRADQTEARLVKAEKKSEHQ